MKIITLTESKYAIKIYKLKNVCYYKIIKLNELNFIIN
jgi:hypothetical protein